METIRTIGRFSVFAGQVFKRTALMQWSFSSMIMQMDATIRRCIFPVLAVVFPFGMVIALQGLEVFKLFGAERMLASLASVAVIRELSPVLACILVAAQAGSANAAELGAMRIEEEIDATEVMAVDGISFHVVPRVIALVIACPILNVLATSGGLAGSFVTAVYFKGENGAIFISELGTYTTFFDFGASFLKTAVFGLIIGLVSCFAGYYTQGGAAGVGRAVNNTVVYSVLTFFVANYFLTSALFGAVS